MMSAVASDWRFIFLGSDESLSFIRSSLPVQQHQKTGKLELKNLPEHPSYSAKAAKNHMFADISFYTQYVDGAEWLLSLQADSMICVGANTTLDDWLEYDWLGSRR